MLVVHARLDTTARAFFESRPIHAAPQAYQPRLRQKTHRGAYAQSTAGLWLLQQAMAQLGMAAAMVETIDFDVHGRPHMPSGPAFSISHSDDFVACAVTDTASGAHRVGIDIEQPRPMPAQRMARLACTDNERAMVAQQPARFFDYWCAREATVKATGRVGLKRIRQIRLDNNKAWLDKQCWTLYPLDLDSGLSACMACDCATETVRINRIDVSP